MSYDDTLKCGVKPGETVCGTPARHQLFVWAYRIGAIEPFPVVLPVFVCDEHANDDVIKAFYTHNRAGGFGQVQRAVNRHDAKCRPEERVGMLDRGRCKPQWQPIISGTVVPEKNPGTRLILSDAISKTMH